jgi:uncharacterized membrane protein
METMVSLVIDRATCPDGMSVVLYPAMARGLRAAG